MKGKPLIDLAMTGYDELFMNDKERQESGLPKIYDTLNPGSGISEKKYTSV